MKHILQLILLVVPLSIQGQSGLPLSREVAFTMDNDVLLIMDHYYTAGVNLTYRRVLGRSLFFKKKDSNRLILNLEYGNKMFTPKKITFSDIRRMDRPYAGWSFINAGVTRFRNAHSSDRLTAEIGLIGRISGMGKLQVWWHDKFGLPDPKGWSSQIINEVVVNFRYDWVKEFRLAGGVELLSQSNVLGGTGQNRLSQQIILRAGDTNPLSQSAFFDGRLGAGEVKHESEFFIYAGVGVDYVLSNIFLEGSLFTSNESPFTVEAVPWVLRKTIGIMHADTRNTFVLGANFLSKEIETAGSHGYITILYAYRF